MANSDYVEVQMVGGRRSPTAQGFGKYAIFAYHTHNTDVYREYAELDEMVDDGFDEDEPAYLLAAAHCAQTPRPPTWLVVRSSISAQSVKLTMTTATEGQVVSFTIVSPDGTETEVSYTVLAAATLTTVATAVELLVEAAPGIASSAAVAVVTATPTTAGQVFSIHSCVNCTMVDETPNPGYAANLTSLLAVTNDFYFMGTEINSELAVEAMAAAAETAKRFYFWQTSDSGELAGTGTLGSGQVPLGYIYSKGFFADNALTYPGARAAAVCGTKTPGGYTLALKDLVGQPAEYLTTTQETNLKASNIDWKAELATNLFGLTGKYNGGLTSGGNLFVDITHGRDWWIARTQERIITVLASADKVSYTDEDVLILQGEIEAQNEAAISAKLFRASPAPAVYAESVADQSPADEAQRFYGGFRVTAEYAGAIQKTKLKVQFI